MPLGANALLTCLIAPPHHHSFPPSTSVRPWISPHQYWASIPRHQYLAVETRSPEFSPLYPTTNTLAICTPPRVPCHQYLAFRYHAISTRPSIPRQRYLAPSVPHQQYLSADTDQPVFGRQYHPTSIWRRYHATSLYSSIPTTSIHLPSIPRHQYWAMVRHHQYLAIYQH